MKLFHTAALTCAALLMVAVPVLHPAIAFAQDVVPITAPETTVVAPDATTVVVPHGNWLDAVLSNAMEIVLAGVTLLVTFASRRLPSWLANIVKTLLTEQLLARAVDFGINATRGAVRGETLNVNVGSEVLANSLRYAIDRAPDWFLKWTGSSAAIREMILARLQLDENASARDLLASSAPVPPKR